VLLLLYASFSAVILVAAAGFAIAEVLLIAAICNLMFSLIAYVIGDLLDSILDL